jgi:hypothetical protein
MNIASALLKQLIVHKDLDTWSQLKEVYLPTEYRGIFNILEKHIDQYQSLPTFEELTFEVRDTSVQEKLSALERIDVDVEPHLLLD